MRYSFIGGSKDGERLEVPDSLHIIKSLRPKNTLLPSGLEILDEEVETYIRMTWDCAGEARSVFILSGLTPAQVFDMLLDAYPPCTGA